jgi:hypothetical protein
MITRIKILPLRFGYFSESLSKSNRLFKHAGVDEENRDQQQICPFNMYNIDNSVYSSYDSSSN